jgi:hypothetical protein
VLAINVVVFLAEFAARRVSGIVYASDIDPLMVSATIDRAAQAAVRSVVVETRDFVS